MSFLDPTYMPTIGTVPTSPACAQTAPALDALFDSLEQQVLSLARTDGSSSLRVSPGLDRLFKRLFGVSRPNMLASPRLEALRRLAVAARLRSTNAAAAEAKRFIASGFTPAQAQAVLHLHLHQ